MPFGFKRLGIPAVVLVEPKVLEDGRGFFMETYKMPDFIAAGIEGNFVQENHSRSSKGVLRGLHYQHPPFAQGKLVRVVRGEVIDVAVDIRKGSPTWGKWVGVILSEENKRIIYVPESFAHGFCVLSDVAEVVYKTTNVYSPESEAGIIWNDEDLSIDWPVKEPIVSDRDRNLPSLKKADIRFYYTKEAR
ncbi:MAG: dTDP-4-dehydrorhamnose 3,5-epimerase [Dehalococcoidia bacterium]|nr:dTDP-4-dehydrorhamnose 3,5-epimerase [Dehalococcoidia bacterium]MDH4300075.1 dTDP-4-dehydrorhamnose 3,5-epimerase [Dehalococcoidia bacterium]MDH4367511.1 dTDP-4-dehydrorhamnose 3,5-epimerase [Dehalococcoidia bacterium]